MTGAEAFLWSRLRKRKLGGFKFRRQHVLFPFIIDFYCVSEKLAVEVDGPQHESEAARDKDVARDTELWEEHQVRVLRFSNTEVLVMMEDVLETILEALTANG
jgi:very-short-patch-repair endonuclease